MKKIKYKGYTIRIYTDPKSFAMMPEQPFGPIPKDAILADKFVIAHMTGFVQANDKTIRLLVHPECKFYDVMKLVGHEYGHKIEGGFKKNPPYKDRYSKRHEEKAEHYENFTIDVYEMSVRIFKAIGKQFNN